MVKMDATEEFPLKHDILVHIHCLTINTFGANMSTGIYRYNTAEFNINNDEDSIVNYTHQTLFCSGF